VLDRYASSLQTRRIALVTECDPELRVLFDRKLVTRVLENMLGNALRYVTSGGVIEVFLKRDGESALLQIANDGPPIAPETRSRLFEKYGMGRGGGDSNRGLGLYFCRLVVAEHGGTIGVRERDGGGVCFEIRLPLLGSRLQQSMQATPISASARSVIAP
jgi:signal transduction histidine kinase